MTAAQQSKSASAEELAAQEPNRINRLLIFGIAFLIVSLLCVVIYALLVGVLMPPAPRTLVESSLLEAQAAVRKNPASGLAWSALAGAQWAAGEKGDARDTLQRARKSVKDHSILLVNVKDLQFLMVEGKDEEALKRADGYLKVEAAYRTEEMDASRAKGIEVPQVMQNNAESIQLFVIKATAEGNLGRWEDAVKTLDDALLLDDRAADLLRMRGWAKLRGEDSKGAATDFEAALRFLPGDESAAQGLKEAQSAK